MVRVYLALGFSLVVLGVSFGLRTLVQRRRFGDSGWPFHRPSSRAAVTHVLIVLSVVLLLAAPVAALVTGEADRPLGWGALGASGGAFAGPALAAGLVCTLSGAALIWLAQGQMGASWRIGVDPDEETELVAGGLFRWVRNPIFTGMGLFALGQALLVPNAVAVAAALTGVVGLQLQVRWIEEPYLITTHGDRYRAWASEVGRFVPGLGRLVR